MIVIVVAVVVVIIEVIVEKKEVEVAAAKGGDAVTVTVMCYAQSLLNIFFLAFFSLTYLGVLNRDAGLPIGP